MNFKFRYADKIVYLFVFIGFGVFALFSIILLAKSHSFSSKLYYKTTLDNAKGLQKMPAISFRGIEIGRVDDFDLNQKTNDIDVDFYIFEDYKSLMIKNAVISKTISPLSGDITEFELIHPIDSVTFELKQFSHIPFIRSEEGKALLSNGKIIQSGDDLSAIINSVNTILLSLQKKNNKEDGSIFHALDNFAKISDQLLNITKTLNNNELLEHLDESLLKINYLINEIPKTVSLFNRNLKQFDTLLVNFNTPKKIANGFGGESFRNIMNQMDTTSIYIKKSVKELYDQREFLKRLIISTNSTIDKMNKTLEGVNNNPLIRNGISKDVIINKVEIDD